LETLECENDELRRELHEDVEFRRGQRHRTQLIWQSLEDETRESCCTLTSVREELQRLRVAHEHTLEELEELRIRSELDIANTDQRQRKRTVALMENSQESSHRLSHAPTPVPRRSHVIGHRPRVIDLTSPDGIAPDDRQDGKTIETATSHAAFLNRIIQRVDGNWHPASFHSYAVRTIDTERDLEKTSTTAPPLVNYSTTTHHTTSPDHAAFIANMRRLLRISYRK
jgi:hypothetical protein